MSDHITVGKAKTEVTAGLLGAKVDPIKFAFAGFEGRAITEARLEEIERRILAIEAQLQTVTNLVQP